MVFKIADSIISPLGETTRENYLAVKAGEAKLCRYEHHWQIPEPFTASLLTEEQNQRLKIEGLTRFEAMAYHSIVGALRQTNLDVKAKNVVHTHHRLQRLYLGRIGHHPRPETARSPVLRLCHRLWG